MRILRCFLLTFIGLWYNAIAHAQDVDVEGITYRIISDEPATAMAYQAHRCLSELYIPSEVQYTGKSYAVTQVEYDAFSFLNCLFVLYLGQVETVNYGYLEVYEDGATRYHGAFSDCGSLHTVDFGATKVLGDYAFSNCVELTTLNLVNVEEIGKGCFRGCKKVQSLKLGENIKNIDQKAFAEIEGLRDIEVRASQLPVCHSQAFTDKVYKTAILKVPYGMREKYTAAEGWCRFAHIEELSPTGISSTEAVKWAVVEGHLHIYGVKRGERIRIFDMKGCLLSETVTTGGDVDLRLRPYGCSIVKVGEQVFKIAQ